MIPRAFRVHPDDNVATLLDDAEPGAVEVVGNGTLQLLEAVKLGHKVALAPIPRGRPVVKFGVPIGVAGADIEPGQWVHLHNLVSALDARSQTLDLHTGAATDTPYV
ncbi:MAG: UxaA family hydrolase [Fimbriimonadaceae bacterium]|nr:UxaA family hydrolase [Fimbriimonadaceae bacterium]